MKKTILLLTAALIAVLPALGAKKRTARVNAEELLQQAREAYYNYNPELAQEKLNKVPLASLDEQLQSRVERMESMMQRVDAVEIIDSLNVNREDFFTHYRLSGASGGIIGSDELERDFAAQDGSTAYVSEGGGLMIWSSAEGLMQSHRLTDGSWEPAELLGEQLNAGGIAGYPYLMQDGVTLYYATEGDDGLGGLDIYVSRRNGESFPAPQNLGMPYNSPYDDFLMVIDEDTGAGWWATDRNSPGEDITIYIFVPAESRVNVDVDDPELALKARYGNKAEEQNPVLGRIASIKSADQDGGEYDFLFVLPNGKRLTSWEDFKSAQARRLMENLVDLQDELEQDRNKLEQLRVKYSKCNKSVSADIRRLENKLRTSPAQIKSISNRIIQLELK